MKEGARMTNKIMLVDDEPDILDLLEKSIILLKWITDFLLWKLAGKFSLT